MSKKSSNIIVNGGYNQITPSGQNVRQMFHTPTLASYRSDRATALQVQSYVTHNAVGVSAMIRNAKRHIVLHAAYYPKYGHDELGNDLYQALRRNKTLTLTVIFTDTTNPVWIEEFAKILRPYFDSSEFASHLKSSRHHFEHLQNTFGDDRVRIATTSRLPMFPIILIDDTIIVGHYAHSNTPAPSGMWFTLRHSKIGNMYRDMLQGVSLQDVYTSNEEVAVMRYIEELEI